MSFLGLMGRRRVIEDGTRGRKEFRGEKFAAEKTLGEVVMENRLLKKSVLGDGEDDT